MTQLSLNLTPKKILYEGLNPEQQQAVMAPLDSAVQVMAGAGTGKTELITRRFAKLALDLAQETGEDCSHRLWVSTFTEKAAREIRERIETYLEASGTALHPKAWVGTFHGLCQRILQRHGDKVKHLKGYTLLSDIELELLRERLIKLLLGGGIEKLPQILQAEGLTCSPACLSLKNLMQLEIGDYERLFEEIIYQIIPRLKASGLSPQVFYSKASQQAEAFTSLLMEIPISDGPSGFLWSEHEQFATGWTRHLEPIAHQCFSFFPSEWEVEMEAQKALRKQKEPPSELHLLKEHLKPFYKTGSFITYDGRKKSAPFTASSRDFTVQALTLTQEKALAEIVSAVYALYQQTLRTENVCDFDDLIQETLTLLTSFPALQQEYQQHFAHFMIDEFQDSNGGQLQLIELLSGTGTRKITVVGDKKQSIYGFRFAEPENLQVLFEGQPHYRPIRLQRNYRSQEPILAIANRITQMMGLDKSEFLVPGKASASPDAHQVTWLSLEALGNADAKQTEIQWISETIADLLLTEKHTPGEIAILVRDHQKALKLEEALEALGVPAIKQRNLGFFSTPVIQQAVAVLEVAHDTNNDFALINLLQRKLTHRELYLLANLKRSLRQRMGISELSYYEALVHLYNHPEESPEELCSALPLLRFLVTTVETFQVQKEQISAPNFFSFMLQTFPLVSPEEAMELKGQKALKQLDLLKKRIYHWAAHAQAPLALGDILDLIKRSQDRNDLDLPLEDEGFYEHAVRILTVHGAKGLEFPVVFMAGVDRYRKNRSEGLITVDPQYPGKLGVGLLLNRHKDEKTLKKLVYDTVWKTPRAQEEELRLFYVGITRAKARLYITSWPQSFPYMNPAFFSDLPLTLVTETELVAKTSEEKTALLQTFKTRYWQEIASPMAMPLLDSQASDLPLPIPLIDFKNLVRFSQCPTQGIIAHRFPKLTTVYPISEIWHTYTLENTALIRFSSAETIIVAHAFPAMIAENVHGEGLPENDMGILQSSQIDLASLAHQFVTTLAENKSMPLPSTSPPCPECSFESLCPYFSETLPEASH